MQIRKDKLVNLVLWVTVMWITLFPKQYFEINDYTRTLEEQAIIMSKYPWKNLDKMYRNKTLLYELQEAHGTKDIRSMVAVLRDQAARGKYISKHLCGKAIDLRTKHLSISKINKLAKELLKHKQYRFSLHGRHLHIESVDPC